QVTKRRGGAPSLRGERRGLLMFYIIHLLKEFCHLLLVSGHEYPFSIQMSHVRNSAVQGGGRDVAAPPADRQMAMQMQLYKQCQFILKPRPVEPPQQHLPAGKVWFSTSSGLFVEIKKTFLMLSGTLPLLQISPISHSKGGIRSSPGPSGEAPHLTLMRCRWPELLKAACLVSRSAPSVWRTPCPSLSWLVAPLMNTCSAFTSLAPSSPEYTSKSWFSLVGLCTILHLYVPSRSLRACDQGLLIVPQTRLITKGPSQQYLKFWKMIRRMSKENALLLRYLLAMLHAVQANAQENQMTSFNLSVCIAPSLLWSPGAPCSPEVCELVKFMIEHCVQILGEDPSSLFGGPPQRRNSEESGSGKQCA
ncbi:hypothetical protein XENOCAPTIV_028314, partial [Xenoophorus captivus]